MRFSHLKTISIISWDMTDQIWEGDPVTQYYVIDDFAAPRGLTLSIQDLPVPCWMATLQSNMATGHPLYPLVI